jgi:shikimate dehydrogenase
MSVYALVGKKLGHSFSKAWFTAKFEREGRVDDRYENIELEQIASLPEAVERYDLSGFNVTIPYKTAILPYLDDLSPAARETGAVNTVQIIQGKMTGHNTDVIGFDVTLQPLLRPYHTAALILGTGGAAKAVAYVLRRRGIEYRYVSRTGDGREILRYDKLTMLDVRNAGIIINTTPLGMYPDADALPDIPYEGVDKYHLLYDLIYNPSETRFMKQGVLYGAATVNGYNMLIRQAMESWNIWQNTN